MLSHSYRNLIRIVLFSFFLIFSGCAKKIYQVVYPTLNDGKYDTEFPYKNGSQQLEEISKSIKKLNYIAYYRAYFFSENLQLQRSVLKTIDLQALATEEKYFTESAAGTATIIYYKHKQIALLTCAHVGDYPDTVISYFRQDSSDNNTIQTVSIKDREEYFVNGLPENGDIELILKDKQRDIAIYGKTYLRTHEDIISVFSYPFGYSGELEWGSFVYVIGYPMGFKMITKGIVSKTNAGDDSFFLIDALFNKGSSGGVVLAIRDGVPNFELVGLVRSVSAESDYFLMPYGEEDVFQYEPHFPYQNDVYVREKKSINYGITYSIPIESIREFFKDNKQYFRGKGYYFDF